MFGFLDGKCICDFSYIYKFLFLLNRGFNVTIKRSNLRAGLLPVPGTDDVLEVCVKPRNLEKITAFFFSP